MFEPPTEDLRDGFDDAPPWWLDFDDTDLATIAQRPAGPLLLLGLASVDTSSLTTDDAVTVLQQWERAAAWLAGRQATVMAAAFDRLTDRAGEGEQSARFVVPEMAASAETAAALRVSPRAADARVFQALDLVGPMGPLNEALLRGELSLAHVSAVRRELLRLPAAGNPALVEEFTAQCATVLTDVVPFARTHTPGQAAKRTRMLVSAVDPVAVRDRRREITERQHGVFLRETDPGTCELTAIMPIAHGHALLSAINTLAKDDRFETADGCVTLGQRRVAAFVTLTLGDPGTVGCVTGPVAEAKLTAHFDVVVPLSTYLAGTSDAGSIGGEAVPADVLWELLAEADANSTLRRLVVDDSGCIIDAGRSRYAISDTQRRIIQLRDVTCRFPGCTTPSSRCDIDHATSWDDGGGTDLENLGSLCRRHHQLKTHGNWRITRSQRNGECTWRSPLGRIYEHQPPDLLPPATPVRTYDCPPPF